MTSEVLFEGCKDINHSGRDRCSWEKEQSGQGYGGMKTHGVFGEQPEERVK